MNPAIEINMVDIFTRKGYRFKGIAKVFPEGSFFDEVLSSYKTAGSKHIIKNIVSVKVERILQVISPSYDTGLTEDEVKERWIGYWDDVHTKK